MGRDRSLTPVLDAPVVRIERRSSFSPAKVHLYKPKNDEKDKALIVAFPKKK